MDKVQTLKAIEDARNAHIAQMQKIDNWMNSQKVDNPTAVLKTECSFGLWLYKEENRVEDILGNQFYEKIDILHAKWHEEYARVYKIFYKEKKTGFFAKFKKEEEIDSLALDKAKLYYQELQETTEQLLKVIAASHRRIEALSDSKFT